MKNLKAKLNKQGGFTLIEMLIVVAIIAILVAVSIPLVNSALERAREATDAANERSFKAVLTISYTNGKYEMEGAAAEDFVPGRVYVFDAAKGTLAARTAVRTGYGKSTNVQGADPVPRKGYALYGYISTTGTIKMGWADPKGTIPATPAQVDNIDNLISPKMVSEA